MGIRVLGAVVTEAAGHSYGYGYYGYYGYGEYVTVGQKTSENKNGDEEEA
jgi:hypothetical protein